MRREARFSPCRTWRYTLERYWDDSLPRALFVLLNPSTADETHDDATNRKGMGFARRWGCGSCVFVNLFAFRSPYPAVMKQAPDPVGPENDVHVLHQAHLADLIVVAWGAHGDHLGRDREVLELLAGFDCYALGTTKAGHPRHPCRLGYSTGLEPYGVQTNTRSPS